MPIAHKRDVLQLSLGGTYRCVASHSTHAAESDRLIEPHGGDGGLAHDEVILTLLLQPLQHQTQQGAAAAECDEKSDLGDT